MTMWKGNLINAELAQAIREVKSSYGDVVSVVKKAKSLHKFGRNPTVGTSRQTVWEQGGDEVYVTTNIIDTVSSSVAEDATTITIEGHTVSGTGTDAQFTFVTQEATVNGRNKVTLGTPLARVSRAFVNAAVELTGVVYVYEDTAITAGVPDDLTKSHITIQAEDNQSFKAATTFSNNDYFFLDSFSGGVTSKTSATVDFRLQVRQVGKVFRTISQISADRSAGLSVKNFHPPVVIPKNADVRVECVSASANTGVYAGFDGYLAVVDNP
jgi:hypothetical protein